MASITTRRLPIICFSDENLKSGAIRDDVRRALEEFGCFEAVYDKVSLELHNAILGLVEELFNLPMETRCKNTYDMRYKGHIRNLPSTHLYEGLGIYDVTNFEAIRNFTNLMWPQGNLNACEIFNSYATKVFELQKMVMKVAMESFGVEKYYESHVEAMTYLLRANKYKAPMTDEPKLGVPTHTDSSFLTLLHQDQVNGLELQTKDGEWIRATPSPSSFILIVGQAFYAWTNGRAHCPLHRVMFSGNKARYSLGVTSFHSDLIQCPEELVDEKHPLLFKPFEHPGLLAFHETDEGRKAGHSALKVYCGV